MIPAFERAALKLFEKLAVDATYQPAVGDPIPCKAVLKIPDQIYDFRETQIHTASQMAELLVSVVPNPQVGDGLTVGSVSYSIQGEPQKDQHGLIWKLDLVKA
ncbi:head-tail joining protein [Pseudemcibacter aquimaris]|uniref:head-tail joining protein n=1 Tax=Pseudemcibacter aquimaris TaxID=2857064 RepID=UPI002012A0D8|nr:hypothetical protein [Pseudemcibacter aquimaris]MCC3862590.1 hypothetical protein [Pseudemcibacter aquimaris]WDU57864.1 hypothetical protein KW060_11715 [Pseudemcibacter aquimaris]